MSTSQNEHDERRADDLVGDSQEVRISGGVNVNADHVDVAGDIVGRDKITQNIRQFIMRPWAWLIGLAILALGIILAAGIVTAPALLPTPTPSPTPLAFTPAAEGQSLIVVADFEDRSSGRYQGIDPAQYIFEQLVAPSS